MSNLDKNGIIILARLRDIQAGDDMCTIYHIRESDESLLNICEGIKCKDCSFHRNSPEPFTAQKRAYIDE